MLEVKDITFSFDKKEKKPLIKNLSFKVKKGAILFISGKSGLGKSTLLDLISGFHDDNLIWKGKIFLNKLDICLLYTSPSPRDLYRSRMPSSA